MLDECGFAEPASALTALDLLAPFLLKLDLHIHRALSAENLNADGIAGMMLVHELRNILLVADWFAINGNDQVAADVHRRVSYISSLIAPMKPRPFR